MLAGSSARQVAQERFGAALSRPSAAVSTSANRDGCQRFARGFQATVTTVYLGDGNDEVTVGGSGRLRAYGENGNDTLVGGNGDDGLYGGIGDDYIEGRNGSNYLGGDSGNDTINADSTGVLKTDFVLGGTGFDKATVDSGVDQGYDVEKVTNV